MQGTAIRNIQHWHSQAVPVQIAASVCVCVYIHVHPPLCAFCPSELILPAAHDSIIPVYRYSLSLNKCCIRQSSFIQIIQVSLSIQGVQINIHSYPHYPFIEIQSPILFAQSSVSGHLGFEQNCGELNETQELLFSMNISVCRMLLSLASKGPKNVVRVQPVAMETSVPA